MLVLNTTSPRASPSAPAATPRYQVPSSSARIASIVFLCGGAPHSSPRVGPHPHALSLARSRSLGLKAAAACAFTLRQAQVEHRLLLLQRRSDSVPFTPHDAHRRRPSPVALVLQSHRPLPRARF